MCGVAGVWRVDGGAAAEPEVAAMLDRMQHRGPDGAATWSSANVALGHNRLKILDTTERAAQPMVTPDERGIIAYNGETYNFKDLRRQLETEGERFESSGDTEVVLRALHLWGPEVAIPQFNGMFAFAYYDLREETLWLARDRAGIKQLAMADIGGALVFASEVKAFEGHRGFVARPDRRAVSLFLSGVALGPSLTGFEGVRQLPAGAWWKLTSGGRSETTFFDIARDVDPDRIVAGQRADPATAIEAVATSLRASVETHLASDVPVATMCSGGVDSSLVTALARTVRSGLPAYVADMEFADGEGDQAERVARHLSVPLVRVKIDREAYLRNWPRALRHLDTPGFHPSDPAHLAVALKCRDDGIRVLLTGEGADELFGGYGPQARTWRRARRALWAMKLPLPRDVRQRMEARLTASSLATAGAARSVTHARRLVAGDTEGMVLAHRLHERLRHVEPGDDRAFLAHCLWSFRSVLSWILQRHDRLDMAASVEARVPFLENDVMDLAFHAARRVKLQRGSGKWAVKRVADRYLPRDVVSARKKGFPAPLAFSEGTGALLAGGAVADELQWSSETVHTVLEQSQGDPTVRFNLVALELWLRLFFRGEDADALGEDLVRFAGDGG